MVGTIIHFKTLIIYATRYFYSKVNHILSALYMYFSDSGDTSLFRNV